MGRNKLFTAAALLLLLGISRVFAEELIIGEKRVEPGIMFIFEGAVKDMVHPAAAHLPESQTNVHLEARVNWDTKNIPEGTPAGGFVPYLDISATVKNQKTGQELFVDLLPHVNLVDNFHYARNTTLPGSTADLYTVTFVITAPTGKRYVSLHNDWLKKYGTSVMKDTTLTYKDINFKTIAEMTRK